MGMTKAGELSIPSKIIELLKKTPGEAVWHFTIWRVCWNDGQFNLCYLNTVRANVSLARELLESGHKKADRAHGYVFFPD